MCHIFVIFLPSFVSDYLGVNDITVPVHSSLKRPLNLYFKDILI